MQEKSLRYNDGMPGYELLAKYVFGGRAGKLFRRFSPVWCGIIWLFGSSTAFAQLLPTPDYSGDLSSRSTLTGDWEGARGDLAAKGFHVDFESAATYQNLGDGGLNEGGEINGSTDLVLQLDTGKADLWPGGLFKIRLELGYGDSISRRVGSVSPANHDDLFPLGDDDGGLTEATFTQFLAPTVGVFAGLLNTLDGDANEIAGSVRSNDSFLNTAFLFSLVAGTTTPSVTLGAGFVFIPNKSIVGSVVVLDSEESSLENPFATSEGTTVATEWQIKHSLFSRPGKQTAGFAYGFQQDFTALGTNLSTAVLNAIRSTPQPTKNNSWAFYYNAHQYVHWENDRGWGVFFRFGVSDGEVNPIDWNMAVGIGGKGLLDSRPNDKFGIGYYHINVVDAPIFRLLDIGDEHGYEAYYNFAVTPWLSVTADVQYIHTALGQPLSGLVPSTRFGRLIVSRLNLAEIPESESAWLGALRLKVTF